MLKVLVPVDGSSNSRHAVRHVVSEFQSNPAIDIHLLNVQPPFSRYISRFVDRKTIKDVQNEESEKALRLVRQKLDAAGVPYAVHVGVGERAALIAQSAQRLHCDHIVMSTTRKNSLIRLFEDSVTNKVLELTTVPVVVIAGDAASKAERYGIPAGVGTGLAWLAVAAAE